MWRCKVKPTGPLMQEHRLIERIVWLMRAELGRLRAGDTVNAGFLRLTVDFISTYADRTHHGKEENILFRALALKQLSPQHEKTMNELVVEHVLARRMVARLARAVGNYDTGDSGAVGEIADAVQELVDFYPAHIDKEDNHFFQPCLEYLSQPEQEAMLLEFYEFDRKLIHEKYRILVEGLEAG